MDNFQYYHNIEEFDEDQHVATTQYHGYVYAIEYGDYIKIGSTRGPHLRIKKLSHIARDYHQSTIGSIIVSKEHTNYRKNERQLHSFFNKYRLNNSELFAIQINDVIEYLLQDELLYLDESQKMEERNETIYKGMKAFVTKSHSQSNSQYNYVKFIADIILTYQFLSESAGSLMDLCDSLIQQGEYVPDILKNKIYEMALTHFFTDDDYKILYDLHKKAYNSIK